MKVAVLHKRIALLGALIAFALAFTMAPAVAQAMPISGDEVSEGRTYATEIEELKEGDTVTMYPIFTGIYTDIDNNIDYTITEAINKNPDYDSLEKLEEKLEETVDVETRTETLRDILNIINTKIADGQTIENTQKGTANADGIATIEGLQIGFYLVTVTPGQNNVDQYYQIMTANLLPEIDGKGVYSLPCRKVTAKSGTLYLNKTIDKVDSTNKYSYNEFDEEKELIPFTIEAPIPSSKIDTYIISDKTDEGLQLLSNTIKVYGYDGRIDTVLKGYETIKNENNEFEFSFTEDQLRPYEKIIIKYNCKLSDNATMTKHDDKIESLRNNATLLFKSTISSTEYTLKDYADVKFYTATFKKVNQTETKGLEGAEFIIKKFVNDEFTPISTCKSGTDGLTSSKPLGIGKYQIVETKVPTGYQKMEPREFTITDDSKTLVDLGNIIDPDQPKLPVTGGPGTMALTALGLVLMVGALIFFIRSRKQKSEQEA